MLAPVTTLDSGPLFRFRTSVKQGDRLLVEFVIDGQAGLVGHAWRAQMRGRNSRLVATPGVSLTLATVTTVDDSLRVAMEVNSTGTALLRPGVYVLDGEDTTDDVTWASGLVTVLRDYSR